MKNLIILLLFSFPFLVKAQATDSTVYVKEGEQWFEVTLSKKPITTVDTLIRNTLLNQRHDLSKQLYELKERVKEKEKQLKEFFRISDRQLKSFARLPEMPRDTLRGAWLYNNTPVTITKNKIGAVSLVWVSEVMFFYNKEYFLKEDNDIWISPNSKFIKVKN